MQDSVGYWAIMGLTSQMYPRRMDPTRNVNFEENGFHSKLCISKKRIENEKFQLGNENSE